MFYVYILKSQSIGRRYVGSCRDLDERVRRHNAGHSKATRHGIAWAVPHTEVFLLVMKPQAENVISKRAAVATNSIG
jgi:predicted GIY-YIG superfamily endonuclease